MASRVTREPLLEQAAASLDAVMAAALAVSLCVGAGSAALAPLALLGGFVQRALAGAEAEVACAFVLRALAALPEELRAAVGGSVFLEPARAVLPDACRALLARADAAERRMLHGLGGRLGQTELTSELAATLFEPPAPPPPAAKHAGGAPSTLLESAPASPPASPSRGLILLHALRPGYPPGKRGLSKKPRAPRAAAATRCCT